MRDTSLFNPDSLVYIPGGWDGFGVGHLKAIEAAKEYGTRLVVGILTDDGMKRCGFEGYAPYEDRAKMISALTIVDEIVPQEGPSPERCFQKHNLKPDYIVSVEDERACKLTGFTEIMGNKVVHFPAIKKEVRAVETKEIERRGDKIAIGIKTFYREKNFFRVIEAIQNNFPYPYKLYIADDGRRSFAKDELYKKLKSQGHEIFLLPLNSGLSAGRNRIINAVKEDYVLIMDDDVEIYDGTAIEKMKDVLDSSPEIGVTAGYIRLESGQSFGSDTYSKGIRFVDEPRVLIRTSTGSEQKTKNGTRYRIADQVVNFFLAKREVFNDVRWDDRILIEYEHMDFFLQLRKTKWKAAVSVEAQVTHLKFDSTEDGWMEYRKHRDTRPMFYFLRKWNIERVLERWH